MKRHFLVGAMVAVVCGGAVAGGEGRAIGEVTGATGGTGGSGANGLLSTEEVKKLMDAGQYQDALKAIVRILNLNGPAAAPYNRHEMLMMKAECQIQAKQYAGAIGSAQLAKKEAEQAKHTEEGMESDALLLLLQRSQNGAYTPVTATVKLPIKLMDKDKRKDAYDALYADAKELFSRKAEAAEKGTSLPPYLELARLAPTLRTAEYGSMKGTTETDGAIKDAADHAAKLVDSTLTDMATKTDRITEEANRIVTQNSTVADHAGHQYSGQTSHRQGLTGTDVPDLNNIDATCKRIPQAMQEFVKAFPDQADEFKKLVSKAQDISAKAEKTLTADYTTM